MALRAGRVGVNPRIVDHNGNIKGMSCNTYTKEEIDQKLSGKANTSDVYTQSQVDTLLNGKADKSDTYTKDATNNILLDLLPDLFDTPPNVEVSGNPLVLTDSAGGNAAECVVTFTPTQSGSGTPSPSNVRPISGRTQSVITRFGKNWLNPNNIVKGYYDFVTMLIESSGSEVYRGIKLYLVSGTYTISFSTPVSIVRLIADGTVNYNPASSITSYTFTVNADGMAAISWRKPDSSNWDSATTVQIEKNATATPYEPYNGETYTIDLDGTRYGGTVDFKTGILTVIYAIVDLGTKDWNAASNVGRVNSITSISGALNPARNDRKADMLCNKYEVLPYYVNGQSGYDANSTLDSMGIFASNGGTVFIYDSALSNMTGAQVKAALSGTIVCYKLATPTTVQLTPETVTVLAGNNVLTTNGTSITLSYPVDVAAYIRRKLGMSIESTRSLSKSLASEEIQEEVKEVSDLTPLKEVVEIKTVEPVETVTTTKTTKRTRNKK